MSDSTDKDLPDEQQLDEYLRGGSAVSRQYRQLRSADVPAELDRLVLRQAQDAVKAKPAKSRTWLRWTGPLALAASAVLVVSILIESGVHEETVLVAPASAPVEMPVRQDAAEQSNAGIAAEKRASAANEAEDKATAGAASDASVVHVLPVQPPSAEAYFDPPPAAIAREAPAPFRDRASATRPTAPPPASAPQAESPPPSMQAPPPAELEQVDVTARRTASTPVSTPAPVVTQLPMRGLDASVEEAIVTATKRSERKQTVGARNTVTVPAGAANSASEADEQAAEPRNYSDPEQWLRDIRRLRKDNKHEEADREWRRFRYVFPNYTVAETDPARGAQR